MKGFLILAIFLLLVASAGWVMNVVKLVSLDFNAPYNRNLARLGEVNKYDFNAVINNFDEVFKNTVLSKSEEEAYATGQLDYWSAIKCDPMRHNFKEFTRERSQYEAGYESEVLANV